MCGCPRASTPGLEPGTPSFTSDTGSVNAARGDPRRAHRAEQTAAAAHSSNGLRTPRRGECQRQVPQLAAFATYLGTSPEISARHRTSPTVHGRLRPGRGCDRSRTTPANHRAPLTGRSGLDPQRSSGAPTRPPGVRGRRSWGCWGSPGDRRQAAFPIRTRRIVRFTPAGDRALSASRQHALQSRRRPPDAATRWLSASSASPTWRNVSPAASIRPSRWALWLCMECHEGGPPAAD